MTTEELQSKIENLEKNNEELSKKLEDFSSKFEEVKTNLETHTHSGNDGSNYMYNNGIILKRGAGFTTGKFGLIDYEDVDQTFGIFAVGDSATGSGTIDYIRNSTQISIEHQQLTNKGTNQTFFYGFRSPLFFSAVGGAITSGGTTLTQSKFSWEVNELAGANLLVFNTTTPTEFDVYTIASNTATVITISGGTWTFSDSNAQFIVSSYVYFGAAQYPWRRIYTSDGSGGGIRFGGGDTNGGQNALLYTDGTTLKFRKKDGTVTTVTVT